ncbi:ABC transporter related protein [Alkalidesulfovibrio alkalitolerans DSM 16529]|uniref:ABC transporter related protein n=1 Tax=Alkalidesulfovibrio alkalitolerans DSM 16529 TaxID=1121439 RepID=S7U8T6_9BACT|nr:ATP-binding cassette domain-containing protein [Alkalidesulfovibrio alkalitolerans]EPR30339.1 ABC transporter related protein [Alkalidesulfovibrio alkalitolerans DSM 16529]
MYHVDVAACLAPTVAQGDAPAPLSSGHGVLSLRGLHLALGETVLVQDLNLDVPPGVIVTVKGRSGAGKSSLLSFLCGALPRTFTASGRIILDGRDISGLPPERRALGILFQDDLLFPHMSVGGNLLFGIPRRGLSQDERIALAEQALVECGLAGFFRREPGTLSGGQRARVALMRTLLAKPRALLLDEPFASLDVETRKEFRQFVFDHARAAGLPTLLVTHDQSDAEAAHGPVVSLDT